MDGPANLIEETDDAAQAEPRFRSDQFAERFAGEQFFDDINGPIRRDDEIIDLHRVRMSNPRGDKRLSTESFERFRIIDQIRPENPHRNLIAESKTSGPIQRSKSVLAKQRFEFIPAVKHTF